MNRCDYSFRGLTLAALCGVLAAATAVSGQTVLVHDQMNNTDRATQNLPVEAAWYKGGGSNVVLNPTVSGMQFYRSDAGTSRLLASQYVNVASGYTLAVGETLRMSYTFSPGTVPTGNAFNTDNRMSILSYANNPSLRYTADNSSANGPVVTNLSGYMFTFHISDALAATPLTLYKINSAATTTFSTTGSFISLAGQSTTEVSATGGLTAGAAYTLQLDVKRTSLGVDLAIAYLDAGSNVLAKVTALDNDTAAITFDGFVYRASTEANFGGTQTITDFKVEVIPEPATFAAIAGLAVLALAAWRRRSR